MNDSLQEKVLMHLDRDKAVNFETICNTTREPAEKISDALDRLVARNLVRRDLELFSLTKLGATKKIARTKCAEFFEKHFVPH